eukprot:g5571.t1
MKELAHKIQKAEAEIAKEQGLETEAMALQLDEESIPRVPQESDYPLLNVPEEELNDEQKAEKKKQKQLYALAKGRAARRLERQAERDEKARQESLLEEEYAKNPEEYVSDLRKKREELLRVREKRKRDQADSRHRRIQSKQRLHLLASTVTREDSSFGEGDGDWDIYRVTAKGGAESESEEEKKELAEYERLLRKFAPEFLQEEKQKPQQSQAEYFQVRMQLERVRCAEVIFQPSLIGVNQAGLGHCMGRTLDSIEPQLASLLASNVFVCGGNSSYPSFCSRLETELRERLPTGTAINIQRALDPVYDTWLGACAFANSSSFPSALFTRSLYDEAGTDYLKDHPFSNPMIPRQT